MFLLQRPRRCTLVRVVAVLALSLVALAERTDPAQAQDVSASDVCQLNPEPGVAACPTGYAPPHLVGRDAYAAMSLEESTAMRRLETQALDIVISTHDLPDSDRAAVATWARPDAQAALFELVLRAIGTDAGQRTPDQQQAVNWMGDLVRTQVERAANRSGAEYARWAGLDVRRYQQLVDEGASEQDLTAFLSQRPQPYNVPDVSKATGGWCKFTPPAGSMDSDYSARDVQSCFTACTDDYLCEPPPPPIKDFVAWGKDETTRDGPARVAGTSISSEIAIALSNSLAFPSGLIHLASAMPTDEAIAQGIAAYEKAAEDAAAAARAAEAAAQARADASAAAAAAQTASETAAQIAADAEAAARAAADKANRLAAEAAEQATLYEWALKNAGDLQDKLSSLQGKWFKWLDAVKNLTGRQVTAEANRAQATIEGILEKATYAKEYADKLAAGSADAKDAANAAAASAAAAAEDAYAAALEAAEAEATAQTEASAAAAAAQAEAEVAGELGQGAQVVLTATSEALSLAGAIASVVGAIITTVEESVRLADISKIPGQLAALIASSRTPTADGVLTSLLSSTEGSQSLFDLFVSATLPGVRTNATCNDDDPQLIDQCLNQTEVPPATAGDPHFVITDPTGASRVSPVLVQKGSDDVPSQTVRISGHWFVTQSEGSHMSPATQGLQLYYRDWDGSLKVVTLADFPKRGLVFVGHDPLATERLDPVTCVAQGDCWISDTIRYKDLDGVRELARIEPDAAPTGAPTQAPSQPVESQVVSFSANGFAPAHAVAPVSYSWQFQKAGCGHVGCTTVTTDADGTVTSTPSYEAHVDGATVAHTWLTSGTYFVRLIAIDHDGRSAVTTFQVPVGGVPPGVSVAEQDTATAAGSPFTLGGVVALGAELDTVTVAVTWGDGTRDESGYGPAVLTLAGSPLQLAAQTPAISLALQATHRYPTSGTYHGTVKVTNQAGQTVTTTFTHTVT